MQNVFLRTSFISLINHSGFHPFTQSNRLEISLEYNLSRQLKYWIQSLLSLIDKSNNKTNQDFLQLKIKVIEFWPFLIYTMIIITIGTLNTKKKIIYEYINNETTFFVFHKQELTKRKNFSLFIVASPVRMRCDILHKQWTTIFLDSSHYKDRYEWMFILRLI